MMTIANFLTLSRIFLAFVFVLIMQLRGVMPVVAAALLFIVAALTDYYDGYFAKKYNQVTDFGKLMDPIADKFLILAAFFVFVKMGLVAGWIFLLIFLRETVLTGFRLVAVTKGQVLAAEKAGKLKTVCQMAAVLLILGYVFWLRLDPYAPWDGVSRQAFQDFGRVMIPLVMLFVLGLTLYSGAIYLWNNRRVFFAGKA